MFIQSEETPNPDTLKFLPGVKVSPEPREFQDPESAKGKSPLALELMTVAGVKSVFFGYDFVSVTKEKEKDWYLIKAPVLGIIMEHFLKGEDVITVSDADDDEDLQETIVFDPQDEEIVHRIIDLIDSNIRPSVARDGGDIQLRAFAEGVVYLEMQGACAGCPSSTATLKIGIENLLKHYIPQVKEVQQAF